jgi:hypothetical protein
VIQWGESNRRKYSGQVLRAFRRYLIFRWRSFPEERTRRDSLFLHVNVSTSDRTADQIGVRREQKVVPSHHEEDQPALLPFPFSRRLSQLESLELTEWN